MVFSRSQGKALFNHVLDSVICEDDDSPLKKSLLKLGIVDVFALRTLDMDTIEALTYDKSDTEKNVSVLKADKNILKAFISYVGHCEK